MFDCVPHETFLLFCDFSLNCCWYKNRKTSNRFDLQQKNFHVLTESYKISFENKFFNQSNSFATANHDDTLIHYDMVK